MPADAASGRTTTILLVRHGVTDQNGRVLSGCDAGVHLNEEGKAQVQALAIRLARATLSAVYSSPLERACETADAIATPHVITLRTEADAAEVQYGSFTGKTFEQLARDETWRRWNGFRSGTRIPDGETMAEVQARVVGLLLRLRGAHPGEQVVLVSHGDVIKAALAHVLGTPIDLMQRIEIQPASVTTLSLDDDGARVLGVNRDY